MYPESVFLHVPTLKINNTPLEYSNSFAHVGLRIQSVNFIRAVPYGFKYILLLREGPLWRPRQDSNWSEGEKDRSHGRGAEWTVAGLDFPRTQIAFPRSTGGGQPTHLRFTVSCRKCTCTPPRCTPVSPRRNVQTGFLRRPFCEIRSSIVCPERAPSASRIYKIYAGLHYPPR